MCPQVIRFDLPQLFSDPLDFPILYPNSQPARFQYSSRGSNYLGDCAYTQRVGAPRIRQRARPDDEVNMPADILGGK